MRNGRLRGQIEVLKAAGSKIAKLPSLSEAAISRLAGQILRTYRHLRQFEVDLDDESTCCGVRRELELKGCKVKRATHKWRLEVTCPDDKDLTQAA